MQGQNFFLSPIANPISTDKLRTKLLKLSREMNRLKLAKRGVKDVVKSLKKGLVKKGLCILAADVTPVDVISHIPILCENYGIPYIFVRSRMELGIASETKKPTSVVLLPEPDHKNKELFNKFTLQYQKIIQAHPFM